MAEAMTEQRIRYEFGRHETFAVREGWLSKGLSHLKATNGAFRPDLEAADALGLGSKMVKSLHFWMEASGLSLSSQGRKDRSSLLSELGECIADHDPYLEFPISWWMIHIALARRPGSVWNWFFNSFQERIFDRTTCVEAFMKDVAQHALNPPTPAVAQREVACLLLSYSSPSGRDRLNPEDVTSCPLRPLALVVKHDDTGRYEKTRPMDRIPMEAFLSAAALVAEDLGSNSIAFLDLIRVRNSPARLFGLDGDAVDEIGSACAAAYGRDGVGISMLGANRTLSIPAIAPAEWLRLHFRRIGVAR
ncbi:DUF4007 family protein [Xanthobacter agilis]|uniref:DUF4007 family protein n=1 Tax=Xanthobacter agilis TaxID=47492 RepID=UPI00372B3083